MLAIKNPSPLQQEKVDKLNVIFKNIKLTQEAVDALTWLTTCETETVEGVISAIKSVQALERGQGVHCTHDSEAGFEKQYSSKE